MSVKMTGPENHSGLAHAGKQYQPAKDGSITVPEYVVPVAKSHGFKVAAGVAEPTPAQTQVPRGPKIVDRGGGKFDVLNEAGATINERPFDKAGAAKALAELQAAS